MPRGGGARYTALKAGTGGRLGSARSKTGDPACSEAMSLWVRARHSGLAVAAEVFKVLAMCRAKARNLNLSRGHQIAGNEAKSQVFAKRAERGLSNKGRLELAKGLKAKRAAALAARTAAGPAPARAAHHDRVLADRIEAYLNRGHHLNVPTRYIGMAFSKGNGNVRRVGDRIQVHDMQGRRRRAWVDVPRDVLERHLGGPTLRAQEIRRDAARLRERPDAERKSAAEIVGRIRAGRAKPAAPATPSHPSPATSEPKGFSLRHESAIGKKATVFGSSGGGKTGFLFDMKKGDLRGQTSLLDKVAAVDTGVHARPFHEQVTHAAAAVPKSQLVGNKAFLHHVHQQHQSNIQNPRMSLDEFKAAVVQDRDKLALSRADLVHGFPREEIQKSQAHADIGGLHKAEFHFVRVGGTGSAATSAQLARHLPKVGGGSPDAILQKGLDTLKRRSKTAGRLKGLKSVADVVRHPETHGKAGDTADLKTSAIHVDPERFQFKIGASSKTGSVGSLAGAKTYQKQFAGAISVWRDPENGRIFVVNGHNRLELAQRLGVEKVHVQFLDAPNAQLARAQGAMTNIAEGRGTALDAAKFFRDSGISRADLDKTGVPMREHVASQGIALAGLEKGLFTKVIDGDLSPARGAIIGGSGLSHAQQKDLSGQLEKLTRKHSREVPDKVLKELVDNAHSAGTTTTKHFDLFGEHHEEVSLAVHRAQVQSAIKQQLGQEKRLFGLVSQSKAAQSLAEKGRSSIDRDTTGKVSEEAAGLLGVFDTLKNRSGRVAHALNTAARRIHEGESSNHVIRETREEIADEIRRILSGGRVAFE
jgi:hypothetical protein